MKQLKFLKTIALDGKAIWHEGCIYDVLEEGVNDTGRAMYKLLCEDFQVRGIDVTLGSKYFNIIDVPNIKKNEQTILTSNKPEKKSNTKKSKPKKK